MFKKILLPTDGSSMAEQAARQGVAFAKQIGAEVVALTVVQPLNAPMGFDGMAAAYAAPDPEQEADMERQADGYLSTVEGIARDAGVAVSRMRVSNFNVADGISEAAETLGCDLIFIASHGRSGLSRLLLGSVTVKVVESAKVSVLVSRH
jgi:nucleotide-binding universal stress UspA family protein